MSAKHNVNNAYLLDEELTAEKIEMRVSKMTALPNKSPSSNTIGHPYASTPSLSNLSITSDYNKPKNLPQFNDIEAAKSSFKPKSKIKRQLNKYRRLIQTCLKLVLVAGWLTYLGFACVNNSGESTSFNKDTIPLLVLTAIGFTFTAWTIIKNLTNNSKIVERILTKVDQNPKVVKICLMLTGLAIVIPSVTVILISDGQVSTEQWISLAGYFIIPTCFWVFSVDRSSINWQPVIGGFLLQLIFGIFVLKVPLGNQIFEYLSEVVAIALDCVEAGVLFVFGPTWADHRFAFKTLPIIIFVSSIVSVLYYIGAMQWIILKIGWLMHALLGTSATESMVAAGNIFIGQTESPLLVRPYLKDCTNSELLAIMAAGMATIAGSVLGAFLAFGANGVFLMTASVMAAPAVLAMSKLVYPEREESKFKDFSKMKLGQDEEVKSIIEAALKGASDAIPLVANIAAVLISFLAIIQLVDVILGGLGGLVGINGLTVEIIFSYVFWPLAYILGVENQDVTMAAGYIGKKIIANEFIAYGDLQTMQHRRYQGCLRTTEDGNKGWMGLRSEAIVTYALCGFANLSSTGIVLGGLSGLAPSKRTIMAKLIFPALIVGALVSCHNAALSGFLLNDNKLMTSDSNQLFEYGNETELYNCTEVANAYNIIVCELPVNGNEKGLYKKVEPQNCKLDETIIDNCRSFNGTNFKCDL